MKKYGETGVSKLPLVNSLSAYPPPDQSGGYLFSKSAEAD